jgi:hypothetical protein
VRLRERYGVAVKRVIGSDRLSPYDIEIAHAGGTLAGNILD